MTLGWAIFIVAVATGTAIAALLVVRRRAPEGSHFKDGDRAAGVFGVLATGFAILLGLIVVVAFTSYDDSRRAAEQEALKVEQQFETAQFLPAAQRRRLSGEIFCYGRFVVHQEWPRLQSEATEATLNPWTVSMFRTLKTVEPKTNAEQSAYDKWLDLTTDRESSRNDRVHGAVGVIPSPLWIVLFLIAGAIFVFMLFFADSEEHAVVQAVLVGSVTLVITATLLLIAALDQPLREGTGGLKPGAMERALQIVEQERRASGETATPPCDTKGLPSQS